ncbi:MAG: GGDEF domain-containing protein [Deltaproteobacteria bacterium]|nr:GGDEF domain-containing protein [Deltaproteobacteria bacterium]
MSTDLPDVTAVTDPEAIGVNRKTSDASYLVTIYGELLGRKFTIKENAILMGRSADCDIQLVDDCVSRNHCRVVPGREGVTLVDLDSTNGTYVNGTSVSARPLKDGDQVKVGRSIFKFLTGDNIEHAYHEEIYRLKTTDGLTGAFNKRHFDEECEREIYRFFRYKRPLSLVMFDIDFFKRVNDEHGHLAGDRVLSQLALLVSSGVRREDTFCRYGGEEFAVLMPEMDLEDAVAVAEKLRRMVADAHFEFEGQDLPVTVSIGVAEAQPSMTGPDDFVRAADERLYEAKDKGRNRVEPCDALPGASGPTLV